MQCIWQSAIISKLKCGPAAQVTSKQATSKQCKVVFRDTQEAKRIASNASSDKINKSQQPPTWPRNRGHKQSNAR